jgi:hypothetical protein
MNNAKWIIIPACICFLMAIITGGTSIRYLFKKERALCSKYQTKDVAVAYQLFENQLKK